MQSPDRPFALINLLQIHHTIMRRLLTPTVLYCCSLVLRFMDLSAVLEPGRTPKTDKPAILDDAIRVLNQLKDKAHELEETNQKLLEEIKSLKAEKHELREEKMALKADKEKAEKQLKSTTMMVVPPPPQSSGYMPPSAYNNQTKMAVYPSYGYMPMWHYLPQSVRDTSRDVELRPPAA